MAVRRSRRKTYRLTGRDRSTGFTATSASFDAPDREDTWHHHGEHDIVAFLIAGNIAVERPNEDAVMLQPGDLVHIERGTIHKEVYRGHIEMVGFNVGNGPGRSKHHLPNGPDALLPLVQPS